MLACLQVSDQIDLHDEYFTVEPLTTVQIHENEDHGDVLVFLPGQEEIESLQTLLDLNLPNIVIKKSKSDNSTTTSSTKALDNDFIVRPLYASLPKEDQYLAFEKSSPLKRKFILATNIAETSVTISGIKYGKYFLYGL
jgi:HrpA-like RNA helicase